MISQTRTRNHTNSHERTLTQYTMDYSDSAFLRNVLVWITTDAVNNYRKLLALFLIVSNIYMLVFLMNESDRVLEQIRIQHPSTRQLHYLGFTFINYGGVMCPSVMLYFAYLDYVRETVRAARGLCLSNGWRFPSECMAIDKYYHTLNTTVKYPYLIIATFATVTVIVGWLFIRVRVVRSYQYTPIRRNTSTDPCVICHDGLCKERAVRLPCPHPHAFHEQCIDDWLDSLDQPSCPMCRAVVPSTNKHYILL